MALEKRIIGLALTEGIDLKTDGYLSAKPSSLVNATVSDSGTVKRRGGSISNGDTINGSGGSVAQDTATGQVKLFGSEMLRRSGNQLYARMTSNSRWADKGPFLGRLTAGHASIVRHGVNVDQFDAAYLSSSSSVVVYAWLQTGGGVWATAVEAGTGVVAIKETQLLSTGALPRVIQYSGGVAILYVDTATNEIRYRTLSTSTLASPGTFSAEATLVTGLDPAIPAFDAHWSTVSERFVLCYNTNAPVFTAVTLDSSFAVLSGPADISGGAVGAANSAVAVGEASNGTQFFVFNQGGDVRATATTFALAAASTVVVNAGVLATHASAAIQVGSNGVAVHFSTFAGAVASYDIQTRRANVAYAAGVASVSSAAVVLIRSCSLASHGFTVGTTNYVAVVHQSSLQPTLFIIEDSTTAYGYTVVARLLHLESGGTMDSRIPHVVFEPFSTTALAFPALRKGRLALSDGRDITPEGMVRLRLNFAARPAAAVLESTLFWAGANPSAYDGVSQTEYGFHLFPHDLSLADGGAGNLSAGTYQVCVVAEWTNNKGTLYRSAPSIPASINFGAANRRITVTIPTIRVTEKRGSAVVARKEINLVVYATTAGGTVFFRVNGVSSPLSNNVTVNTVTFDHNVADATVAANEVLYTTGGRLENMPPPACAFAVAHKRRFFVAGCERAGLVAYSHETGNDDLPGFHESLVDAITDNDATVTGLGRLSDKLVAFTGTQPYYLAGNGPNLAGLLNDFSGLQPVVSEAGLFSGAGPTCETPLGLLFKGQHNVYLLPPDLSPPVPVGTPVQTQLASLSFKAVTLFPQKGQVRFSNGLVWDYVRSQWSTFTGQSTAVDSVVWVGAFNWLGSDKFFLEANATVTDAELSAGAGGTTPQFELVTQWLNFAGLQGIQRVRRLLLLAHYASASTLTIEAGYDYEDAFTTVGTFSTGTTHGDTTKPLQLEVHLPRQKCEAIRFRIRDSGAITNLTALSLEVGVKPGTPRWKLPAGKRV